MFFSKEAKVLKRVSKRMPGQIKLAEAENCFYVSESQLFSPRLFCELLKDIERVTSLSLSSLFCVGSQLP